MGLLVMELGLSGLLNLNLFCLLLENHIALNIQNSVNQTWSLFEDKTVLWSSQRFWQEISLFFFFGGVVFFLLLFFNTGLVNCTSAAMWCSCVSSSCGLSAVRNLRASGVFMAVTHQKTGLSIWWSPACWRWSCNGEQPRILSKQVIILPDVW